MECGDTQDGETNSSNNCCESIAQPEPETCFEPIKSEDMVRPPFFGRPERRARSRQQCLADEQQTPPRIPVNTLVLGGGLCLFGIIALIVGILMMLGLLNTKYTDRMWPLVILGLLMFIPGSFITRIAYYAYYKTPGFNFEDIAKFE